MPVVIDPVSGLELYELSHRWGMYTPIFPGYEEIKLERITHHAKQGVMTHKITTIFHTSCPARLRSAIWNCKSFSAPASSSRSPNENGG
jgi:hypothetical protein